MKITLSQIVHVSIHLAIQNSTQPTGWVSVSGFWQSLVMTQSFLHVMQIYLDVTVGLSITYAFARQQQ